MLKHQLRLQLSSLEDRALADQATERTRYLLLGAPPESTVLFVREVLTGGAGRADTHP